MTVFFKVMFGFLANVVRISMQQNAKNLVIGLGLIVLVRIKSLILSSVPMPKCF